VTILSGDLYEGDIPAQLCLEIYAILNVDNSIEEYKLSSEAVVSSIDPETGFKLNAHTCPLIVKVIRE
jgi:hypothetical protein